jgi:hypothetical protein
MSPSQFRRRALFALVAGLYVLSFPYHPKLRSPNELARLYQTRAIVEFGKVGLNETLRTYGPVGDLSVYDSVYYSSKAPLMSFLAVPIYWVLRHFGGGGPYAVPEVPLVFWCRLLLTVLPTLGLLVLVRKFLRAYVSEDVADAVTATYALGSLAFSYSLLFMSHQATAVLLFVAFYALWKHLRGEWPVWAALLTGVASGATVMAEYTGALGVLGLAGYAVIACLSGASPWRDRWVKLARIAGLVVLGAAPLLGALMAYHASCFGGPLESGYRHLAQPQYQPWHLGGFLGIKFPSPTAFALSFFSPLRGFLTLAPFLALAVPGMVWQWRATKGTADRALFWLSGIVVAGYAYFTSSFSYESWGWTTGPRHLTPLVVFLLLPVALCLDRLEKAGTEQQLWRGLAGGLCAASILVTGAATMVNYIPDDASTAVFGLAWPLFVNGYLPPSVLAFWGVPNPLAGGVLLVALVAAAALVLRSVAGALKPPAVALVGAVTCVLYLGLLSSLTRHDAGDRSALGVLESSWLFPPGQPAPYFWPRQGS